MTREEARKAAEVMMAYADGKEIEFNNRSIENNHHWEEATYPVFDWYSSKYRIKSEPKYRPFKTKEECWNEMLKHQPFGWIKKKDGSYINKLIVMDEKEGYGKFLEESITFADGTPFGVKED